MSRPEEALEQMALLRDYLERERYQRYIQLWLESPRGLGQNKDGQDLRLPSPMSLFHGYAFTKEPEAEEGMGAEVCEMEKERIKYADPYFVSAEMMPLLRWAAHQLPDDEKFAHDVWPSDFGFVWFEESYRTLDVHNREMIFKAFTWGRYTVPTTGHIGTLCILYTDGDELVALETEEDRSQARDMLGRLQLTHCMLTHDGESVGPEEWDTLELYGQEDYRPLVNLTDDQIIDIALNKPTLTNDHRIILALLMLLNQTVTDTTEYTNRRVAKRFRRMNLPERVTVVRLRRVNKTHQMEGESRVEWFHRWVVKGHWRNQPYRDRDTHEVYYKRIWIAPYIKGPEDKPFMQTEKVYGLVR